MRVMCSVARDGDASVMLRIYAPIKGVPSWREWMVDVPSIRGRDNREVQIFGEEVMFLAVP